MNARKEAFTRVPQLIVLSCVFNATCEETPRPMLDHAAAALSDRPPDADALIALVGRWLDLGEVERRAFLAMTEEVSATSSLIENSTLDLTQRFRDLAGAASAQTGRVQQVAAIAREVDVGGRQATMSEVVDIVGAAVTEAVDALQLVSRQAATMVQALDAVVTDVVDVEQLVGRIENINTKARYVALNAAIEASRGAAAGGTFKVIAHELQELSQQTDSVSRLVRTRVASIAGAIRGAHLRLKQVATGGSQDHDQTRARLDGVLAGLVAQNRALNEVLDEAGIASQEIAATVSHLISGAQFQDRATQHLSHVSDALAAIGEIVATMGAESRAVVPELRGHEGVDERLIQRLLGQQTLSTVRRRFLDRLVDGATPDPLHTKNADGDIELF